MKMKVKPLIVLQTVVADTGLNLEPARRKRLRNCENGVWLHRVAFACSSPLRHARDRFN